MSTQLPPAAQTCAIVVGIEAFVPLGAAFAAPGAVAGALAFARWLVLERGVPPAQVQLWLAPADGQGAAAHAAAKGLAECDVREFTGDAFWLAMAEPPKAWPAGWLAIYVCGHGVVSGLHNEQFLVLPEATDKQFQCIDTRNWREHFRAGGWERFGHQLWISDACRNTWGDAMKPLPRLWNPGAAQPVRQCVMFSCAAGGTASLDSKDGPRFTRELLARLPGAGPWPAFDKALLDAAAAMRADPELAQWPMLSVGEDWFGAPLQAGGGPTLREVFEAVGMDYEQLRPYVQRALPPQRPHALPDSLDGAFELLAGLPEDTKGVPPLCDFAARVARAMPVPALQEWLQRHLSPRQTEELKSRLDRSNCRARLLLWYRDERQPHGLEAELQVVDAGPGLRGWPRLPPKPVTPDTVATTIGQWLQELLAHAQGLALELTVELFLPRQLLTAQALDTATVPLGEDDERRLGEEDAVLLHCTDRLKPSGKRERLLRQAPAILARLGQPGLAARWAKPGEAAKALREAFVSDEAAAPVWLAFDHAACGGDGPLKAAIDEGLPAVVWLRVALDPGAAAALQASLDALLHAPLAELPQRLRKFRQQPPDPAGPHVSLLLDDPAQLPRMHAPLSQPAG